MNFEWKCIYSKKFHPEMAIGTWRAKVIGGWLVLTHFIISDDMKVTTNFISDPNYEWEPECQK